MTHLQACDRNDSQIREKRLSKQLIQPLIWFISPTWGPVRKQSSRWWALSWRLFWLAWLVWCGHLHAPVSLICCFIFHLFLRNELEWRWFSSSHERASAWSVHWMQYLICHGICPEKSNCTRKQIGYTFINSVLPYRDQQLRDVPNQT